MATMDGRNLAEFQKPRPLGQYYRNRWQDQPRQVCEIWLEKNTSAVFVREVARQWDCTIRISAGSFSRPFLVQAAAELAEVTKPITILYLGDFDPKGLNI